MTPLIVSSLSGWNGSEIQIHPSQIQGMNSIFRTLYSSIFRTLITVLFIATGAGAGGRGTAEQSFHEGTHPGPGPTHNVPSRPIHRIGMSG